MIATMLKSRPMSRERILVVDDEEDLLELVNYNLSREGFRVECVATGEAALAAARKNLPDLIVLDLLLPSVDGLEICRRLKSDEKTKHIPIIMLTAKSEESDMVTGLELGADDYMTKPFSPRVLLARIKAILRRKAKEASTTITAIQIHELVIHPGRHEVLIAGQADRADVYRVPPAAFSGAQARLGVYAIADCRRREGRGLSCNGAERRRAGGRFAKEARRLGRVYRNGAAASATDSRSSHVRTAAGLAAVRRVLSGHAGGAGGARRGTGRTCSTRRWPAGSRGSFRRRRG